MYYETPTNEWNREARRAAEIMAEFRNSRDAKDEDGFMVVIGYQLNELDVLHIGWCPKGRVGDHLMLVQHGNPHMLGVRSWLPATVAEVSTYLKALEKCRCRTDDQNWIRKLPQVEAYLAEVRDSVYGTVSPKIEIGAIKSAPASTLLMPPKKAPKKRRPNKRQQKRRRH